MGEGSRPAGRQAGRSGGPHAAPRAPCAGQHRPTAMNEAAAMRLQRRRQARAEMTARERKASGWAAYRKVERSPISPSAANASSSTFGQRDGSVRVRLNGIRGRIPRVRGRAREGVRESRQSACSEGGAPPGNKRGAGGFGMAAFSRQRSERTPTKQGKQRKADAGIFFFFKGRQSAGRGQRRGAP